MFPFSSESKTVINCGKDMKQQENVELGWPRGTDWHPILWVGHKRNVSFAVHQRMSIKRGMLSGYVTACIGWSKSMSSGRCYCYDPQESITLLLSDSGCFQPDIRSCEGGPVVSRLPCLVSRVPELSNKDSVNTWLDLAFASGYRVREL